eukprot:CAMPEP_0179230902 /NCGR_PEP_ID=MMETSP0797-20121207/11070_1 /TAXON_ID=47934 /ORGANISM="Dinophysis acuminata, Strain DAEP01" /LENGTH=435 /DNA_ID=CAMNT_0020937979 /DNA_START=91 /DNA_END=1398 /DNA_ORIENTATION=+
MCDESITKPLGCISIPVGKTSLYTCAERFHEHTQEPEKRLFEDEHAGVLAGEGGRALLKTMHQLHEGTRAQPINSSLVARTMFLDAVVNRAVERGIRQILVLAAGMDTRVFRLRLPQGIDLWELDFAEVLQYKTEALRAAQSPAPTCNYTPVGVDLQTPDWEEKLVAKGFSKDKPSCVIIEGLFIYLPIEDTENLFKKIAGLMAETSVLAGDWMTSSYLSSALTGPFRHVFASFDSAFATGCDNVPALLSKQGLSSSVFSLGGDNVTRKCHRLTPNQLKLAAMYPTADADGSWALPSVPRHFLFVGEKAAGGGFAQSFRCAGAGDECHSAEPAAKRPKASEDQPTNVADCAQMIAKAAASVLGIDYSSALHTTDLTNIGLDSLLAVQLAESLWCRLRNGKCCGLDTKDDYCRVVLMHTTPEAMAQFWVSTTKTEQ